MRYFLSLDYEYESLTNIFITNELLYLLLNNVPNVGGP